jgi:hypothetical protein
MFRKNHATKHRASLSIGAIPRDKSRSEMDNL